MSRNRTFLCLRMRILNSRKLFFFVPNLINITNFGILNGICLKRIFFLIRLSLLSNSRALSQSLAASTGGLYVNSVASRGPQCGHGIIIARRSLQVRLRPGAFFVEQLTGCKTIKAIFRRNRVRFVARDQVCEAPTRSRCRLEPAIAPAAIQIEAVNRGAIDDRRSIECHVHDAAP